MLGIFVLAPIIIGTIAYLLRDDWAKPLIFLFQFSFIIFAINQFLLVKASGPIVWNTGEYTDGIALSLYADTLSIFMVLMTAFIYFTFLLYAENTDYFHSKFYFLFMVLQGLIIGLFLSSDLFNIFVFSEVSTIVVSILIMINKEKQAIYDGMIYFFVNVLGSSFLLFGAGMIYRTFGLLDLRAIQAAMPLLTDPKAMILPYAMLMVAVSNKTAVMPLFSWLPKAHGTPSAPPVISAVLSGLYIKSGVYLFIRFNQVFEPAIDMQAFFFWVGFFTSVLGVIMAIGQRDMKLFLAYSTVSQVGLIIVGLNMGTDIAYYGAIFHIFNHALFKSTLFLSAGLIEKEYGERNIHKIRGLLKQMPWVSLAIILSMFGISGAPFFNGSISKYMIASGTSHSGVTLMLNIINLGTILSYVKFSTMLFGKRRKPTFIIPDTFSLIAVVTMGIVTLLTGVLGTGFSDYFLGFSLQIDAVSYVKKGMVYVLMLLGSIVFYQGVLKRDKILLRIGESELTFNGIVTVMTGYFIMILIFLTFTL
ncbi:complex I subunit 5 family protein [Alkalibacterium kapii]|uniref:Cation:proton antiporter n=1 Tax=Alkalibacterium kapii TaxID=426704 RepID=A0A511AR65_9LACT|nr:proton-conducting transporter membrane subunit [Alkalibacterium kapii]GEK90689.1 cation:proton antiporter [Alkalibacterium kapii]